MLLIMIFDFFVGFADVYVAGFVSPQVQAAVGFVSLLYFFVIIIANAISTGTVALVSRAIGGGDFGRALKVARQSLLFGGLVAVLVSLFGLVFYHQIIAVAGFPPEIREIAETFLRIFAIALGCELSPAHLERPLPGERRCEKAARNDVFRDGRQRHRRFRPRLRPLGYSSNGISRDRRRDCCFRRPRHGDQPRSPRPDPVAGRLLGEPGASCRRRSGRSSASAGRRPCSRLPGTPGRSSCTTSSVVWVRRASPPWRPSPTACRIEAMIFLPAFALNMAASVLVGQNLGAGNPAPGGAGGVADCRGRYRAFEFPGRCGLHPGGGFCRPRGEGFGGA